MQGKRPNIIVILADDLGPWALGCAGNSEIQTPKIDQLAAAGTCLEKLFCVSPVCSPARAWLLTGRIPEPARRAGLDEPGRYGTVDRVPHRIARYSKLLAGDGYTCGLSGKWHLGATLSAQQGFGHRYAMQGAGGPSNDPGFAKNGEAVTENGYLTDLITKDALGFIDEHAGDEEPFYLSINHYAPHGPWIDQHPHELTSLYTDCPFESCRQDPAHPGQARSRLRSASLTLAKPPHRLSVHAGGTCPSTTASNDSTRRASSPRASGSTSSSTRTPSSRPSATSWAVPTPSGSERSSKRATAS